VPAEPWPTAASPSVSPSRRHLTIYNALDENGLLFGPQSQDWREHKL
jgi:hypothetical protein